MALNPSRTPEIIEQDFLDALDRLRAGLPQHPKHKQWLKKRGAVDINISTVAREAGRSRALIAGIDSHYQKVRNLILAEAGESGIVPGNRDDVICDLRAQVAELRVDLRSAREHAAYQLKLRSEVEKRYSHLAARYERLNAKTGKNLPSQAVVHLFPKSDE